MKNDEQNTRWLLLRPVLSPVSSGSEIGAVGKAITAAPTSGDENAAASSDAESANPDGKDVIDFGGETNAAPSGEVAAAPTAVTLPRSQATRSPQQRKGGNQRGKSCRAATVTATPPLACRCLRNSTAASRDHND